MLQWGLFLDENVASRRLIGALAAAGHVVVPIQDKPHLLSAYDWDLLEWCFIHNLVVVTKNRKHFENLHADQERRDPGSIHAGIIILPDWKACDIEPALLGYLAAHSPNDVVNAVVHLPSSSYWTVAVSP